MAPTGSFLKLMGLVVYYYLDVAVGGQPVGAYGTMFAVDGVDGILDITR